MNKRKIRRVVRTIAPEIKMTFNRGKTIYYDYVRDKINIDFDEMQDDGGFMRHLNTDHAVPLEFCQKYSLAAWSILHELGHYFCDDDEEESQVDELTRLMCALIPRETATVEEQDLYFNLPHEWNATEWAIEFATEHETLMEYLEKQLILP